MVAFQKSRTAKHIVRLHQELTEPSHVLISGSAGLNYCAVATLDMLERLTGVTGTSSIDSSQSSSPLAACARWMLDRQTTWVEETEEYSSSEDSDPRTPDHTTTSRLSMSSPPQQPHPVHSAEVSLQDPKLAGFNGRINKVADTCYCFWNCGALAVGHSPCPATDHQYHCD